MTDDKMSSMEALSFPEGTRFTDGLAQRLVRSGDGFFCEDCNVNHNARDLSLTFLKLADTEDEPDPPTFSGDEQVPSIEESLARIATALEKTAEALKKTTEEF